MGLLLGSASFGEAFSEMEKEEARGECCLSWGIDGRLREVALGSCERKAEKEGTAMGVSECFRDACAGEEERVEDAVSEEL